MGLEVSRAARRAQVGLAVILLSIVPWFLTTGMAAGLDAQPMHDPMHHERDANQSMEMAANEPADAAAQAKLQAKLLADKNESERNHHIAGFFLVMAGFFVLFQSSLRKRWPVVKYVWPLCFLLAGIFVMIWSDTELWPFGHRHWLEALQNNREVLQHKIFAILLLALGAVEWQRVRGILVAAWSAWVFPVAAIFGSVILVFHQHEGGMVGPHHMETMARIQTQHLGYTACGVGIGLVKGLTESSPYISAITAKMWPSLLLLLGVLLMFYRE
ncbi:MAG TPA: hypothetical protein VIW23_01355 [Candidatus Acidoferrum sp.]|jgi:hypothetical protein